MAKKKAKRPKAKKIKPMSEPAHWQERQLPTQPHMLSDHGRQAPSGARQRIWTAAMERALIEDQPLRIQAWAEAEEGYILLERALGAKCGMLGERVSGGGGWEGLMSCRPIQRLQAWSIACTAAVPMIDYVVVGDVLFRRLHLSFKAADRANGKRDGWAVAMCRRALDLWHSREKPQRERATIGMQLGAPS